MRAAAKRRMLCAMLLVLGACSSGSSGSDGAAATASDVVSESVAASAPTSSVTGSSTGSSTDSATSSSSGSTANSMTAQLAWAEASGPVAGYRVAISRNDGTFKAEFEVSTNYAILTASPGDTLRVKVAALDGSGNRGTYSPASDPIVFAMDGQVYVQSSSATGDSALASATSSATSGSATDSGTVTPVMPEEKTRFDFDGDRASDLLWEAPEPGLALHLTRFAGGALAPELDFDRPASDWLVVAADDFDGDGRADLLWENAKGTLAFSRTSRLYEIAPAVPLAVMGALGSSEFVVATGDFNADGRADLLVRDDSSAAHSVWLTDADGVGQRVALGGSVAAGSTAVRVGDFDGDGHSDIAWQDTDGNLAVHFMDGASVTATLEIASASGHEILASGDFDGDASDDLVHADPATGAVGVLLMSGRRQPVAWSTTVDPGLGWGVAAAGDYDGDGRADLLWESGASLALGLHPAGSDGALFVLIDAGGDWILFADQ